MSRELGSENLEAQKACFEQQLWRRAEELSAVRNDLQRRLNELYGILNVDVNGLTAIELEARRPREDEYWRIEEEIKGIRAQESDVERALFDLAEGDFDPREIERLVSRPPEERGRPFSKKKERLFQEKQRLGVDPREIRHQMYPEFGPEKMRLTTGRHYKRVKDLRGVAPEEAAAVFYHRTTDTHGGKTRHGKKGDIYITSSGKRIRKR